MLVRQITHDDLGCASYLVGDTKAGVAARDVFHVASGGVGGWPDPLTASADAPAAGLTTLP